MLTTGEDAIEDNKIKGSCSIRISRMCCNALLRYRVAVLRCQASGGRLEHLHHLLPLGPHALLL